MFCELTLIAAVLVCSLLYFIAQTNKRKTIDLHGKHCVITGGSSGIGYELAIESFKQGANVSIIARNLVNLTYSSINDEILI